MLISELSKRTGLSIHTLRFYENLGLIRGRADEDVKSNKYKQYEEDLVETIHWIVESKKAGFTLAEINAFIQDCFNDKLTMDKKMEIVDNKIKEVDAKIAELKNVKKFLQQAKIDVENGLC